MKKSGGISSLTLLYLASWASPTIRMSRESPLAWLFSDMNEPTTSPRSSPNFSANVSFTTATGVASGPSRSSNSLPAISGIPIVLKYPGPTSL